MEEQGLIIDWASMPTYNTIMALATGATLMSLAQIGRHLIEKQKMNSTGWALNLALLGILLFTTGLHMTLTWPLGKYFPYDNIVFGEPSLAIGVLALVMAIYFWKKGERLTAEADPIGKVSGVFIHFRYILYGLGLALIATGVAGIKYQLFAAPPEEPITGMLAPYPMIEATFISLLWAVTGLSALLTPGILNHFADGKTKITGKVKFTYILMYGCGLVFLLFGAMNYFTHIGLIVNTMPE